MHLVGSIIKKLVTMHGHMNIKKNISSGSSVQGTPLIFMEYPVALA
jgi:hypothetical protein